MPKSKAQAGSNAPSKSSEQNEGSTRDQVLYYAGVVAIIAGIIATWDDEASDIATTYVYRWHEQIVRKNWNLVALVIGPMMACISFRKNYHSACTPLFSFMYVFMHNKAHVIATDLFFGDAQSSFGQEELMHYTLVWALINLDPMDTLFKFTQNEHVSQALSLINISAGSGGCALLDGYVEKCGGDAINGFMAMWGLGQTNAIVAAIEQKLSTGSSANTDFHKTSWGFSYGVMANLAYYFACFCPETSEKILAMHPTLQMDDAKDKIIAMIAWVNIWNGLHSQVIGGSVGPSEFVKEPINAVFGGFHQSNKVAGKA